jgi:AP-3 complex subunit beta
MAFNSLAQNADRLSQRIQESLQERTRDFTRSAAATYLDAPDLDKPGELTRLLNSGSEREKLEGLKRIIAVWKTDVVHRVLFMSSHAVL